MASDTLSINRKTKELLFGRRRYTSIYALVCPFSNEPLLAVGKADKSSIPRDGFAVKYEEFIENYFGVALCDYGDRSYQDVRGKGIVLRYFFGKPLDDLLKDALEHVFSDCENETFEHFRRDAIDGKLKEVRIGKELVSGADSVVAVICQ